VSSFTRITCSSPSDFPCTPRHTEYRADHRSGHVGGGNARQRLGMPGEGPQLVITDKAIFDFGTPTREMRLVSLHPGITLDEVRAEIGWDLQLADTIAQTPPPTEDELRVLREDLAIANTEHAE